MTRLHLFAGVLCTLLATAPACTLLNSFSESSSSVSSISESIADSSTSSSDSSSDSSGGGDSAWFQIENDVKQYTAREVEHARDVDDYLRGVGEVCDRHAVTNWEEVPAVYRGIGAGLAASALGEADALRFAAAVAGSDNARMTAIREAYRAAQR